MICRIALTRVLFGGCALAGLAGLTSMPYAELGKVFEEPENFQEPENHYDDHNAI